MLLLLYGMRRGEVLGLRWQDIDTDADLIRVRQQIQRIDTGLVFTTRTGRLVEPRNLVCSFVRICDTTRSAGYGARGAAHDSITV